MPQNGNSGRNIKKSVEEKDITGLWERQSVKGDKVAELFPVEVVNVERLLFNKLNPNVLDKPKMVYLASVIGQYKFSQYPVVAPDQNNPDDPECDLYILDGAHRAISMIQNGYKKIPVIIVKHVTEEAAFMLGSVSYNRPRGDLDGKKMAALLTYGLKTFGEKKVVEWTRMNKMYIDEYAAITSAKEAEIIAGVEKVKRQKIDDLIVKDKMRQIKSQSVQSFGSLFTVYLQSEEHDFVVETLKLFGNNMSKALYNLCREYRKMKGSA